jgi:hypothetical protein
LPQAIHQHFIIDNPDPEVKAIQQQTQQRVNELWKDERADS